MGFVYFALIYNWLNGKINQFGIDLMGRLMVWASGIALVLVTIWIMVQGYRLITGQSRDSMMAMVLNMTRIAIVVTAATTMSIFGGQLQEFFTTDLTSEVNQMFTGSPTTAAQTIDENLAWSQLALAAIDSVQVPPDNGALAETKTHALLFAGFGTASPPMAAAAMLLLYQFTMALFIGLGPLFILCLIFDQTKDLFRRWLLYGIGTIFSIAALAFVSSLVLQLTLRVAAALWGAGIINAITDQNAEGFSSQALQQGGLGLLMTVLIISVPPMAAMFFQGTVGNFYFNSAFGNAGGNRQGPDGRLQSGMDYAGYETHYRAGGRFDPQGSPAALPYFNVGARLVTPTSSVPSDGIKRHES
jgi:type IV secretion system protein VirB6